MCEIPEGLDVASTVLEIEIAAGSEQFSLYYLISYSVRVDNGKRYKKDTVGKMPALQSKNTG